MLAAGILRRTDGIDLRYPVATPVMSGHAMFLNYVIPS
jgi:hypothetical protein